MSKQPPPAPTESTIGPCPAIIQISRTPRHWELTSTFALPDHPPQKATLHNQKTDRSSFTHDMRIKYINYLHNRGICCIHLSFSVDIDIGSPSCFSTCFAKGNNFCDFLLPLTMKPFQNEVYTERKDFSP